MLTFVYSASGGLLSFNRFNGFVATMPYSECNSKCQCETSFSKDESRPPRPPRPRAAIHPVEMSFFQLAVKFLINEINIGHLNKSVCTYLHNVFYQLSIFYSTSFTLELYKVVPLFITLSNKKNVCIFDVLIHYLCVRSLVS